MANAKQNNYLIS